MIFSGRLDHGPEAGVGHRSHHAGGNPPAGRCRGEASLRVLRGAEDGCNGGRGILGYAGISSGATGLDVGFPGGGASVNPILPVRSTMPTGSQSTWLWESYWSVGLAFGPFASPPAREVHLASMPYLVAPLWL